MLVLKKETEIIKEKPFLTISNFKSRKIKIPNEMIYSNSVIKGTRRTGKTDKVLIPAFEKCQNGILYIDYNNESENTLREISEKNNRTLHVFYNNDLNLSKIIEYILKGHIVYFNIRPKKQVDLENLSIILKGIYDNRLKIKGKLNIFVDNIQFLGKLNAFPELIVCDNIIFLITLCYTQQIKEFYGEEVINLIKTTWNSYDVEKQQ